MQTGPRDGRDGREHPREERQGGPGVENFESGGVLCQKVPTPQLNKSHGCEGGALCDLLREDEKKKTQTLVPQFPLLQNGTGLSCKSLNNGSRWPHGSQTPTPHTHTDTVHPGGLGFTREQGVWAVGVSGTSLAREPPFTAGLRSKLNPSLASWLCTMCGRRRR